MQSSGVETTGSTKIERNIYEETHDHLKITENSLEQDCITIKENTNETNATNEDFEPPEKQLQNMPTEANIKSLSKKVSGDLETIEGMQKRQMSIEDKVKISSSYADPNTMSKPEIISEVQLMSSKKLID